MRGLSWRSVIIGLLLIPLNIYWITVIEVKWYTLDGTSLPLFITPIFILFVLCMLNLSAARIGIPNTLDRAEMTIIYVMLVVSSAMAGHDMLQNLFGAISHPYYFATPENKYQEQFFRFLPKFLLVHDKQALADFYNGNVSPWSSGLWIAWVLPLTMWGIFLMILCSMMLAVNILLRKAWTQNEKLVFPLIQLPVAMTAGAEGHGIFRTKALWFGFWLAFLISLLNGLHILYPQLPHMGAIKQYDIGRSFTQHPWNAIANARISMYPFAIGMAFFLPLDLSFSCWFFFFARLMFQVFGRANAWDGPANAGFPFFPEQAAGAWISLGIVTLLGTRHYLKKIYLQMRELTHEDEPGEARDYKIATAVIFVGVLFLAYWSMLLNIKWWVAVLFFAIYLLLSLTITRVRAELGTPHEIYFVNPHNILITLFGSAALGPQSLTSICTMYWFNRGMRCHPMPNMMESFKMAELAKIHYRSMAKLILATVFVGIIVTYWANLQVTYAEGAQAKAIGFKWWLGTESFRDRLSAWLTVPKVVDQTNVSYLTAGFIMVLALKTCRTAWVAWPFHPAGYALAVSYAMDYFWFAFFISWMLKAIIIRYGGMSLHNKAVPFFLGLVLGDFVMGSLWALIGPAMGITTYKIFI